MKRHALPPLEQLQRLLPELPNRQRRLAEFVLDKHRQLLNVEARKLALLAGVSESTISRLIHRLGYPGFAEFIRDITDHLMGELESSDWLNAGFASSPEEALTRVIDAEILELERLAHEFPRPRLATAVNLISRARQVFVLGAQSSAPLAVAAAYELGKLRKRVFRVRLSAEDAAHFLSDAAVEDCALVFGFARYPRRVMAALELLQANHVPIIAIAHADTSPVARLATVCLPVHLRYYMLSTGYSPTSALLNAIITGVYHAHPQRSLRCVAEFERTIGVTQIFEASD